MWPGVFAGLGVGSTSCKNREVVGRKVAIAKEGMGKFNFLLYIYICALANYYRLLLLRGQQKEHHKKGWDFESGVC